MLNFSFLIFLWHLKSFVKLSGVNTCTKFVALLSLDNNHAAYPVSWFIYFSAQLFSDQLIRQLFSLLPPSLQLVFSVARAVLVVCFYLLLDVVLQEGDQVYQRHLPILPTFSSLKVDPHLSLFLLSLFHGSCHLLGHCLHSR